MGKAPVVGNSSLAVEVVDLEKVYRIGAVEIPALRGVNLKIGRGEFVAIVGPSGSGKSTLLNMLGALDRPTSGQVYIDGIDISRMSSGDLARLRNEKIGFVFQAYNLIQRTPVIRNIELPAMVRGLPKADRLKKASGLLEATGIGDKAGRKPTALSGGEQQRVAIARALINDPAIILADEPTGNVDSKVGMEIVGLLRKISVEKEATILVVTHNPEVATATDRIIHLRDGMVEREEILDEVKR
jgi:putative ABC transport system ATP-binding protein